MEHDETAVVKTKAMAAPSLVSHCFSMAALKTPRKDPSQSFTSMSFADRCSTTKELSKGFVSTSSLLSLDETASNSSLASSSLSLSSGFSSVRSGAGVGDGAGGGVFFPAPPASLSIPRTDFEPEPEASGFTPALSNRTSTRTSNANANVNLDSVASASASASHCRSIQLQQLQQQQLQQQQQQQHHYCPNGVSEVLLAILSRNRDKVVWEETEDDLYIDLNGNLDRLEICREFYFRGTSDMGLTPGRSRELVRSLGCLLSNRRSGGGPADDDPLGNVDFALHDEHVAAVASVLSMRRHPRTLKLAVVEALYKMCLPECEYDSSSSSSSSNQAAEDLLEFLTNRNRDWNPELLEANATVTASESADYDADFDSDANETATTAEKTMAIHNNSYFLALVCELRARCLRDLDLERERIRSVANKGDTTAVWIATGAKLVELGIHRSNRAIEGKISTAGRTVKGWIDEGNGNGNTNTNTNNNNKGNHQNSESSAASAAARRNDRDAVVVRAFSGSAKRASEYAKQSSKLVAESTLDTALSSLYRLGTKLDESSHDRFTPENRERIRAAGKVGMASVGALALVAEAVAASSKSVSQTTVGVTADTIGHKYGSVVGDVARDAADTYDNVLQTMSNLALVSHGSKLVQKAAKTASKNQVDGDVEHARKVLAQLEKQGAAVAKQALGIEWNEGSLAREWLLEEDRGDGIGNSDGNGIGIGNGERQASASLSPVAGRNAAIATESR